MVTQTRRQGSRQTFFGAIMCLPWAILNVSGFGRWGRTSPRSVGGWPREREETVTGVECHGNITVPYTTCIRHPPGFRLSPQAPLIEANARSGVRRASVDATLRTDSVNLCCSFACLTTPVLGSRWCAPPHTHTRHRGHGSCNVETAGGFWGGSVEAGASPGKW